jgi:hypothetical protein
MRPFTVDEFHRMIDAGIFPHDEHFEMLDGFIYTHPVLSPPHAATLQRAHEALRARISRDLDVRIRSGVTMSDSEAEPNLAVVNGQKRYDATHPRPADVELIVEIAESSLRFCRTIKASAYARGGIRRYWIVSIPEQTVEVYTLPPPEHAAYPAPQVYSINDSVPLTIGQTSASIAVMELFNG